MKSTSSSEGFTLIEMCVTVAVFVIIASILIPMAVHAMNVGKRASASAQISEGHAASHALFKHTGYSPFQRFSGSANCWRGGGIPGFTSTGNNNGCWVPGWSLNNSRSGLFSGGGYSGWRGPYMTRSFSQDPWNNDYYLAYSYYFNAMNGRTSRPGIALMSKGHDFREYSPQDLRQYFYPARY